MLQRPSASGHESCLDTAAISNSGSTENLDHAHKVTNCLTRTHTHMHTCAIISGAPVTNMLPYVCVCVFVCLWTHHHPSCWAQHKPVRLCECPDSDMSRLCVTSRPWVSGKGKQRFFLKLCAEQRADVRINTVQQWCGPLTQKRKTHCQLHRRN